MQSICSKQIFLFFLVKIYRTNTKAGVANIYYICNIYNINIDMIEKV